MGLDMVVILDLRVGLVFGLDMSFGFVDWF